MILRLEGRESRSSREPDWRKDWWVGALWKERRSQDVFKRVGAESGESRVAHLGNHFHPRNPFRHVHPRRVFPSRVSFQVSTPIVFGSREPNKNVGADHRVKDLFPDLTSGKVFRVATTDAGVEVPATSDGVLEKEGRGSNGKVSGKSEKVRLDDTTTKYNPIRDLHRLACCLSGSCVGFRQF